MLCLKSVYGESRININLMTAADQPLNADDRCLFVKAASNGFAGQLDVWVHRRELFRFSKALLTFKQTLRGVALLRSTTPRELFLEVLPGISLGKLALEIGLGCRFYEGERVHWHSVAFSFEFDPDQLKLDMLQAFTVGCSVRPVEFQLATTVRV